MCFSLMKNNEIKRHVITKKEKKLGFWQKEKNNSKSQVIKTLLAFFAFFDFFCFWRFFKKLFLIFPFRFFVIKKIPLFYPFYLFVISIPRILFFLYKSRNNKEIIPNIIFIVFQRSKKFHNFTFSLSAHFDEKIETFSVKFFLFFFFHLFQQTIFFLFFRFLFFTFSIQLNQLFPKPPNFPQKFPII